MSRVQVLIRLKYMSKGFTAFDLTDGPYDGTFPRNTMSTNLRTCTFIKNRITTALTLYRGLDSRWKKNRCVLVSKSPM